jgi:Tfp pilus assembly protein PilO
VNTSRREVMLALITALIVLLGVTYWIVSNKMPEIREIKDNKENLTRLIEKNERIIRKRAPLEREMQGIIANLPQHPMTKDVKYDLVNEIRKIEEDSSFSIDRLDPGKERKVGDFDLYELSIDCDYSSTIEPLTYFLYNLQARGIVMNVTDLSIKPSSSRASDGGKIKGKLTVDFAFTRTDKPMPPAPEPIPADPPPTEGLQVTPSE